MKRSMASLLVAVLHQCAAAAKPAKHVLPLQQHGADAYYAEVSIGKGLIASLLVDTGSSYVVLPGATRDILGLSALRRMGRFEMRFEPPALALSSCQPSEVPAAAL